MRIYQAFVGDEQRRWLSPVAQPWDASGNTEGDQREYDLFRQAAARELREGAGRPWGLVSWKFEHKSRVPLEHFHRACASFFDEGFDCVYLNPMIGAEALYLSVWEQGFLAHPGMDTIANVLQERLGIVLHDTRAAARNFAFCNYFVARPQFWDGYFEFVDRALAALEAEVAQGTAAGAAFTASANYPRAPTLGLRPFVIERLFAAYADHQKPFRVARVEVPRRTYRDKFGLELAAYLQHLGATKRRASEESNFELLLEWDRLRRPLMQGSLRLVVGLLDDPDPLFLSADAAAARRAWGD